MSAPQFTPGPWHYVPLSGYKKFAVRGPKKAAWNSRQESICRVGVTMWLDCEANARLIAAAPRMYAFVERVREELLASDDPKTAGLLGDADALLREARGDA